MTNQPFEQSGNVPPPHPGGPGYYDPEPRNGLAISSLVLGIVGLLFAIVPLTGFIAFILGAIGLILGLSNRGRLKRGRSSAKKMTISGIVISLVAMVVGIIGIVIVFTAVDDFGDGLDCISEADTTAEVEACN